MLSYMKCGKTECEKPRLLESAFCEKHAAAERGTTPPEGLRAALDKITCQHCRLGFERLANGKHVSFTSGTDGVPKFRHEDIQCASKADEILAALAATQRAPVEQDDDSPGDVIAAYPDGTIVLDDGITTHNARRAKDFLTGRGAPDHAREGALLARLDEARWWHPGIFTPNPANKQPDPLDFHYIGCQCQGCGRIEQLERALADGKEGGE